ncbi:response regulator [Demequina sp.]|uniref:response regulator n=1 Tax=Demequina sp. TaxID=2050685 RepID=UPI003A8BED9F
MRGRHRRGAEAADGEASYAAFVEHRPDVLVLDFGMPMLDGLEVASRVLAEHPEQRILMLTRHAWPGTLRRAFKLGIRGFLGKHSSLELIAEAIAQVHAGGRRIDPAVSAQALI